MLLQITWLSQTHMCLISEKTEKTSGQIAKYKRHLPKVKQIFWKERGLHHSKQCRKCRTTKFAVFSNYSIRYIYKKAEAPVICCFSFQDIRKMWKCPLKTVGYEISPAYSDNNLFHMLFGPQCAMQNYESFVYFQNSRVK